MATVAVRLANVNNFLKIKRQNSSAKMVFYTYDYSSHTGDHLLCSLSPALAYKLFLISSMLRGMSRYFQVAPSVFSQGTGWVRHDFLLCIVPTCLAAPTPLTPFIRQGFCLELAVKRKMASALRCWGYRRVSPCLFGSLFPCCWAWRIVCRL